MKISKIDIEDCTVYKLSDIVKMGIEKAVLSSVYGRAFVVNDRNTLLGVLSVDDCKKGNDINQLKRTEIVFAEGCGTIHSQVLAILEKNIYYGILPIIGKEYNFLGGVTVTDNTWDNDKIFGLSYLDYLNEKNIDFGKYFVDREISRVAFWGVDKLSLTFANLLRHCEGISVIGIYDNIKKKKNCKEDVLNYEMNINYVNSFCDVLELKNIDFIIVTDWTMRHVNTMKYICELKKKVVYANTLLKSQDFEKAINQSILNKWKEKFKKKGVNFLSVRIPIESEIHKEDAKRNKMNLSSREEWYCKENNWNINDRELKEFNDERHKLSKNVLKMDGNVYYADFRGKYYNIINKSRIVLNLPNEYDNTIYLLGPCIAMSFFNQDKDTLGFYLQEKVNDNLLKYRVIALGIPNDASRYYSFNVFKSMNLKKGDIIFYMEQPWHYEYFDLDVKNIFLELYQKYGNDFYYDIPVHCGKLANQEIAKFLFQQVMTEHSKISNDIAEREDTYNKPIEKRKEVFAGNPQLEKYKTFISSEAIHKKQVIGSIVMNCNPFTFGHQYLIEYAASQVDYLYIFVVEEDKSFFKFNDRITLVKAGTKHLKNVKVLPSGEFIISSNTFSEYFDKANLKGTVIDTSLDVETFAQQIAPILDITIRFVGQEPLDPITNQYNQSMKEILPKYGIELREIPRKEMGNGVISASRVRKCLDEKNWDEIKGLVPDTTYQFLYENY